MLKLEIKMDDQKMIKDKKYKPESVYKVIDDLFQRYHIRKEIKDDGTHVFYGTGDRKDYGSFGFLITSLREWEWFMEYVVKWIWYNSDRGHTEDDFSVEDVLYYYTKKESIL